MKLLRYLSFASLFLIAIAFSSCQKNSGGPEEDLLVVETSPAANGHLETPAPGPDFPLRVNITSPIPASGVKIDITGKPDGGTVAFFTTSRSSTTAVNDFTITGTPSAVVSVIEITVTFNSSSSNKWTGNYKYSRK